MICNALNKFAMHWCPLEGAHTAICHRSINLSQILSTRALGAVIQQLAFAKRSMSCMLPWTSTNEPFERLIWMSGTLTYLVTTKCSIWIPQTTNTLNFRLNKEKLSRVQFEPGSSGLVCQRSKSTNKYFTWKIKVSFSQTKYSAWCAVKVA